MRGRRDPRPGSEPRLRHLLVWPWASVPLRRAGGGSSYPSGSGLGLHELARAARRCHVAHSTIVPSLDPVLELTWDTGAWYGGTRTRGWCTEHGLCQGSRLKSQTQRAQQGTSPRGFMRSSGPCKRRDPGPGPAPLRVAGAHEVVSAGGGDDFPVPCVHSLRPAAERVWTRAWVTADAGARGVPCPTEHEPG